MDGFGFHYGPCGGKVLSAGGVLVLIVAGLAFAARHAIGQALGEAVMVAAVVMAAVLVAVPVAVVFLIRHNRRQAVMFAARRAELEAAEETAAEARALARHQRRLELNAASAPVTHVHVWPAAAALEAYQRFGTTPTIIHEHEEITR